ncbi:MAG: radical SAM protein [Oligoflexia bacterium]|nr:radical SAM protein [Oligoflexia bacterium]
MVFHSETVIKNKVKKVLLINPSYSYDTYFKIDRKAGSMRHPLLSLASIAGAIVNLAEVEILDLDIEEENPVKVLREKINTFCPNLVGITATTPLFNNLIKISKEIKEINSSIIVIAGGVHATSFPKEALQNESIDIVAVREGDFVIRDLIECDDIKSVKGIYLRIKDSIDGNGNNGNNDNNDSNDSNKEKIYFTGERELIKDLDLLPFPRWELYDIKRYEASKLIERFSPGGMIETSRGCPFLCTFCNKNVFGKVWRKKSINRVVDEFERMKQIGFKEIHVEDDGFSTDINRAKEICREIIKREINIPWTLVNGIRVDRVDQELFELLKKAGCYQVAFGIESGDEEILRLVNKGITLKEIESAVRLASNVGLETFGFFMFGLKGETEESLQRTVDFAKKIPLTIAKFAITVPLPGTPYHSELEKEGRIIVHDWEHYLCHNNKEQIFIHANLTWKTIQKYYKKAYRSFYMRPSQIIIHLKLAIKTGTLIDKMFYVFKTRWF